jgi:hypothetical protein
MENAPVVGFAGLKFRNSADHERFSGWMQEAYMPLLAKTGLVIGLDRYRIVKESPLYPNYVTFYSYENIQAVKNSWDDKDLIAIERDVETTFGGKCDWFSHALYRLLRNVHKELIFSTSSIASTKTDEAPVISVEAYNLPFPGKIRYESWFEDYGYDIYLPLLMKLPGVIAYNHYQLLEIGFIQMQIGPIPEQPSYLSVVHFENVKAYENYAKSKEVAAFRAAIKSEFSGNLEFKWYVQYQLTKSWRK